MTMPFFAPGDDPGPNFPALVERLGLAPNFAGSGSGDLQVPHATTCVAVRFADGVVMAGDRRATSGNLISHRTMEKVAEADRYSGVAIAGAAGPAMEMVKLFQLQLEHYEKVEGSQLSLDGKANQLSISDNTLTVETQGLALPRGDDDFRLAVDRAVSALYRTGQMEAIFKQALPGAQPGMALQALFLISPQME